MTRKTAAHHRDRWNREAADFARESRNARLIAKDYTVGADGSLRRKDTGESVPDYRVPLLVREAARSAQEDFVRKFHWAFIEKFTGWDFEKIVRFQRVIDERQAAHVAAGGRRSDLLAKIEVQAKAGETNAVVALVTLSQYENPYRAAPLFSLMSHAMGWYREVQEEIREHTVRCRVCNRPLTNEKSVALGIGPVCRKKAARSMAIDLAKYNSYVHGRIEKREITRLEKVVGRSFRATRPRRSVCTPPHSLAFGDAVFRGRAVYISIGRPQFAANLPPTALDP